MDNAGPGIEQLVRRPRGRVAAHLVDVAVAVLLAGAIFTWYGHYYAPFATPTGPVRWQTLAIVPVLFWVDLRALAEALTRPELFGVAALPPAFIAALIAIVRSPVPRWLRIALHVIACAVFVVGTIFVVALLNVRVF